MNKQILIDSAFFVVLLILTEIVRLLVLKSSVKSFARYWENESRKNADFIYVALGDSAAQGIGARRPSDSYVSLIACHMKRTTGRSVRIINLSVSGAKVADVTKKQIPQLERYKPDLITLAIGSNDAVVFDSIVFEKDYGQLLKLLPDNTIIANLPYFGGRIKKNDEALIANRIIQKLNTKYYLALADLQAITRERQSIFNYAADWFHPSSRGYQNWYTAFLPHLDGALQNSESLKQPKKPLI